MFPSSNTECFKKLMAFYEAMEGCLRAKRTTNRRDKRKKGTMKMLESGDSWQCKSCDDNDKFSRMTLTAEECRDCRQKRPAN